MPLLELGDVEARYGAIRALHGISLTVGEGEVVALLGANGAGKTTTLRAVSGARPAAAARSASTAARSRVAARGVARLGIAHVPEGRGIFAELSVWDNLRMGAYGRRLDRRAQARDRPRLRATSPGCAERLGQQAATLSGGEQQMLALARALVSRPRLLMLDEPSLGLAPHGRRRSSSGSCARLNEEGELTCWSSSRTPSIALRGGRHAPTCSRSGAWPCEGTSDELRATRASARATWATRHDGRVRPADRQRPRDRRDLRQPRARARPDLPLDRTSSTSPRARWRCSRRTSRGR